MHVFGVHTDTLEWQIIDTGVDTRNARFFPTVVFSGSRFYVFGGIDFSKPDASGYVACGISPPPPPSAGVANMPFAPRLTMPVLTPLEFSPGVYALEVRRWCFTAFVASSPVLE